MMENWLGNLGLAYKYATVFGSLIALTFAAGLVKVFFDRRKLKKFTEQKDDEPAPREEQMDLNHREKHEGDLFGIRAIEAGYFAGIPQSAPTSRAGSPASAMMSSSTLVGGLNSPKIASISTASSVTSLPLAYTQDRKHDSDMLSTPPRRPSPSTIKLRPSKAELSGRLNHNAAVNMGLDAPPPPGLARHSQFARFSGSEDGESVRHSYKSEYYAPVPPQVPLKNGLRVSVQSARTHKSHAASVNDSSPLHSPNRSGPSSPRHPPLSYMPSMPERAGECDQSRFTAYREPEQLQNTLAGQPPPPTRLLPQTYQPVHQRDTSSSSNVYRNSAATPKHERNFSMPENEKRNSVVLASSKESPLPPVSKAALAPLSSRDAANDPRFSEFYDVYFRNSRLSFGLKLDAPGQNRLEQ